MSEDQETKPFSIARSSWYHEYVVSLILAIAIVVIMLFGAIFGGKDRWSILLVGAAALVAVASVTETQRTRKANEAMVIENQATRKVMAETLIENQKMRRFIERARFEEIKPRLVVDMAEYHDKVNRGLRLVFHNEGRGVAILREVTLTEHLALKDDPPTERDIVLRHTFPEIIVRPHQSRHTNIRSAGYGDLMIAFVAKATFIAQAKVYNINDEHIANYERTFAGGLSDWYIEADHGTECGEWLSEDGIGVGAIA